MPATKKVTAREAVPSIAPTSAEAWAKQIGDALERLQAAAVERDPSELVDLLPVLFQERARLVDDEARLAFYRAFVAFKADPPTILHDKQVNKRTRDGRNAGSYSHASHAKMLDECSRRLAEHGIAFRFIRSQPDAGLVTVRCLIFHVAGHLEFTESTAPVDVSGSKNPIQAIESAATYLERGTLKSALGISTDENDDDGQATGASYGPMPGAEMVALRDAIAAADMTEQQAEILAGKSLPDLNPEEYRQLMSGIQQRIQANGSAA